MANVICPVGCPMKTLEMWGFSRHNALSTKPHPMRISPLETPDLFASLLDDSMYAGLVLMR